MVVHVFGTCHGVSFLRWQRTFEALLCSHIPHTIIFVHTKCSNLAQCFVSSVLFSGTVCVRTKSVRIKILKKQSKERKEGVDTETHINIYIHTDIDYTHSIYMERAGGGRGYGATERKRNTLAIEKHRGRMARCIIYIYSIRHCVLHGTITTSYSSMLHHFFMR